MSLTRNVFSAVLCVASSLASGYAQPNVDFVTHTYPTGPIPRNLYAVDVNNDGVPDLIQDTLNGRNQFTVSIANGDGSFRAPVTGYAFPVQYQGVIPMASGDFNGDGKVDLIFELAGSNQLAVFLGKGDGTFQAPKFVSIALPTGQHFGGLPMVAADFNKDGKLDLVTGANTNTAGSLYLMEGDGTGNFGAPRVLFTPAPNDGFYSVAAGDFDGDGQADLAFTETLGCNRGICGTTLHVMYGDGAAGFRDTTVYSTGGIYQFSTGDVDSNGTTDIFGVDGGTLSVVVLYGQTYRAFTRFSTAAAESFGSPVLGDFNGDGKMDLAVLGTGNPYPESFVFYLANDAGGLTEQVYGFAASNLPTNIVAGDFNRDTKPDLAVVGQGTGDPNSTITVGENVTPNGNWGGCSYPHSGQGIALCATTGTTTSPVRMLASANSYGQLRKMELWMDGKKIGEQHHTWGPRAWFDLTSSYASGSHRATLFAADIDNRLQKTTFSFTVGATGACSAPTSPGVHVCKPANGSTVSSPVQVQAAATITGTLARMEVWVDGVKKFTETTSTSFTTSIALGAGKHRFDVYSVNTAGTKYLTTVYATVN